MFLRPPCRPTSIFSRIHKAELRDAVQNSPSTPFHISKSPTLITLPLFLELMENETQTLNCHIFELCICCTKNYFSEKKNSHQPKMISKIQNSRNECQLKISSFVNILDSIAHHSSFVSVSITSYRTGPSGKKNLYRHGGC